MLEEFKWILIYLVIKVIRGGGGALVHVYVWEHIVTLNCRITWWIFTKLCRDKVLKTLLICIHFWAKSAQWWIQGRAIIGQWGPFSKGLLLQSWKATATNRIYSSDLTAFGKRCCYFFFVPFWCLVFDMFWCCTVLDLVISTYFNHINGTKCLIHINLCTESDLLPFLFSCV